MANPYERCVMQPAGDSIRLKARLTGLFWLGTILTGVVGEVLARGLIVARDPARTAESIVAAEALMRVSIAANLLTNVCYLGVTVLLYELLRPVSRSVARFGLFAGTLGLAAGFVSVMLQIAPLVVLKAPWVSGFSQEQLQSFAYLPLAMRDRIFPLGMTVFGLQMATSGWLITRSTFFPRWVGGLLGTGGAIYILGSLGIILLPGIETLLVRTTMLMALIGEGTFTFWLLAKSVDREQWILSATRAAVAA
jgi:hypothetical protein